MPSPLPSLALRAARDSGQPTGLVQAAVNGYAAQIRHMEKVEAAAKIQIELARVAESYGARSEVPDTVFSECTQLIMAKFPGLGVNEIREAYRMKAANELEIPGGKGEMWGGVFNADQLGAVLSAYMEQRRRALGAYLRNKQKEMEAAQQEQIRQRQQEEFDREFPALIEKMKAEAKDWRDCYFWLYESAKSRGLIHFDNVQEAQEIFQDALELARLEAENAYSDALEGGGLGVFKIRELQRAMENQAGLEARARTIARQITLYRKIVLTK